MNAITLALYAGFAIFTAFPYKNAIVSTGPTLLIRTFIAIALYAAACAISYYVIRKHLGRSGPRDFFPKAVLIILDVCFLLTLGFVSFGIQHVITLPDFFINTFGSSNLFFWWFIAPLAGLFFF